MTTQPRTAMASWEGKHSVAEPARRGASDPHPVRLATRGTPDSVSASTTEPESTRPLTETEHSSGWPHRRNTDTIGSAARRGTRLTPRSGIARHVRRYPTGGDQFRADGPTTQVPSNPGAPSHRQPPAMPAVLERGTDHSRTVHDCNNTDGVSRYEYRLRVSPQGNRRRLVHQGQAWTAHSVSTW